MANPSNLEELLSGLYHSFRAPRRRYVIKSMDEVESETFTTRELARKVAARELDVREQRATGEPYRNAYNALSQTHLPTLSEQGIIIYDPARQTVIPGVNFRLAVLLLDTNTLTVNVFSSLIKQNTDDDVD